MKKIIIFASAVIILLSVSSMAIGGDPSKEALDSITISLEKESLSTKDREALIQKAQEVIMLGLPSKDIDAIISGGLSRKMDVKSLIHFLDVVIEKGIKEGLPPGHILNKIEQGIAKSIQPQKILYVAGRVIENLKAAETVVEKVVQSGVKGNAPEVKKKSIETISSALEIGIPSKAIEELGHKAIDASISLSQFENNIEAMTNFYEIGMPLELASKVIGKAISLNYSEKDIGKMTIDLIDSKKYGMSWENKVMRMDSAMDRGGFEHGYRGMESRQTPGVGPGMSTGMDNVLDRSGGLDLGGSGSEIWNGGGRK